MNDKFLVGITLTALSIRHQSYGSGGGTCLKTSTPASWNSLAEASSLEQYWSEKTAA